MLYGGELARLGWLTRLGKISPSLRNYEKLASRLGGISVDFALSPSWVRCIFSIRTRASGSAREGGIEFSLISFVLFFTC